MTTLTTSGGLVPSQVPSIAYITGLMSWSNSVFDDLTALAAQDTNGTFETIEVSGNAGIGGDLLVTGSAILTGAAFTFGATGTITIDADTTDHTAGNLLAFDIGVNSASVNAYLY
jgi:hypothetical protein